MNDYISRDRLYNAIEANSAEAFTKEGILDVVNEFPKAVVQEIEETAFKVLFEGNFIRTLECGRCGNSFQDRTDKPFDFCPYCGARMVE